MRRYPFIINVDHLLFTRFFAIGWSIFGVILCTSNDDALNIVYFVSLAKCLSFFLQKSKSREPTSRPPKPHLLCLDISIWLQTLIIASLYFVPYLGMLTMMAYTIIWVGHETNHGGNQLTQTNFLFVIVRRV